MELSGKSVIITGAGRGVGRALAIEFARNGAKTACCARTVAQIAETVEIIRNEGGVAMPVQVDVTDKEQVDSMVAAVTREFGGIDILFNNAGRFNVIGGIWEVDPDDWWLDVTVNLKGTMLCSRAVLPQMMAANQGIIINMRGGDQIPGGTGYSCSKVAVTRLTELMAKEQEKEGTEVMVFAMGPGFVHTEMTEIQVKTEQGRKWLPSSKNAIEQGRTSPPEKCARTTLELVKVAKPELNGKSFSAGQDLSGL